MTHCKCAAEKCAWIRSDKNEKSCPFGLPITEGCRHAGNTVLHMCPLESVSEGARERVQKANRRLYVYYRANDRCLYAAGIVEQTGAVNCDFGDSGEGQHAPALEGSPMYTQTFSGMGVDGLHAFPLGMYSDNLPMRNIPYGLFSLVGSGLHAMIRNAAQGSEYLRRIVDKTLDREELSAEEMDDLKGLLEMCRQEFEDKRFDSAKLQDLVQKWDPRKK